MSVTVRIYVNNHAVDVPEGAAVIDAVARWNAAEADFVRVGHTQVNDSRGLPAAPDSPVYNGAIFRLVRARSGHATDTPDPELE